TTAAVVVGLFIGWPLLPVGPLELTHGWLLLLLGFVAASVHVRRLAWPVPSGWGWARPGGYGLALGGGLAALFQHAPYLEFLGPALACLAWRGTEGLPHALTDNTRPGAAALQVLAHVGAMPWDALRLVTHFFRWAD